MPRDKYRLLLTSAIAMPALIVAGAALAQDPRPSEIDVTALGPQVGEIVPDFALPDQTGTVRTRDSIMGPRGAMLVFVRSAEW